MRTNARRRPNERVPSQNSMQTLTAEHVTRHHQSLAHPPSCTHNILILLRNRRARISTFSVASHHGREVHERLSGCVLVNFWLAHFQTCEPFARINNERRKVPGAPGFFRQDVAQVSGAEFEPTGGDVPVVGAGSYPREHPENARVGIQSEARILKKKRRRGVRPSKEHDCQYTMARKYILLRTSCGSSSHAHSPHGEWFETLLPASERPTKEQGHP